MLDNLYNIDAVRQFLTGAGARHLGEDDPELPPALRGQTGECWLLPTNWRHTEAVVVSLGETYPDDPPNLFLPASLCSRIPLLPHVAENGDICTLEKTVIVNPDKPLEVLKRCIEVASSLLDREWTDEELKEPINEELAPYWNFLASKTILFSREDLGHPVLEIRATEISKTIRSVHPSTIAKYPASADLAFAVEIEEHETVSFLRSPKNFLASSESFTKKLDAFVTHVSERNSALKNFDLFILLVAKLRGEDCVLAAFLPQFITARRKTAAQLRNAITGALSQKGLVAWRAEDISTRRLLRRSSGPTFPEARLTQRIAIIGCGSLGSLVADGLSRSGIRNFFLCDFDILTPPNLLRHLLPKLFLYENKAGALDLFIKQRLPDASIQQCRRDIRTREAIAQLDAYQPDLVFLATGDTNTDVTIARLLPTIRSVALAYCWADPDLAAGHLIYQPAGAASELRNLHSEKDGEYIHSLAGKQAALLKESGCQSSYSPYSGLAIAHFATVVSTKLCDWLTSPPTEGQILRMPPTDPWERME